MPTNQKFSSYAPDAKLHGLVEVIPVAKYTENRSACPTIISDIMSYPSVTVCCDMETAYSFGHLA